jgi:hypothetical protein
VAKPIVSALSSTAQGVNTAIAAAAVLIIAAVSWLPHLPNSLLLDEIITFWVVKDGLAETLDRGVHYQSQLAYFVLIWLWTQVAGTSEIALRLPSLIAALGACAALAKLGTSLTRDRETGLLAMVVFASTWNAFRESVDARPYMLGLLALLCLALCLIRWLDKGRWRDAWGIGVLAAVLPHLQLFFVLTYPAFFLYAALRWAHARSSLNQVAVIGFSLLVGAIFFVPAALTLVTNAVTYSFAPDPPWGNLFSVFAWAQPTIGLLVGIAVAGALGSKATIGSESKTHWSNMVSREAALPLALWVFLPPIILFGVSLSTEISIFVGRYLIPVVPAVCILYAIALRGVASGPARVLAVIVIVLASLATHMRAPDDLRGAALTVNDFVAPDASTPILFASGLVETQDEKWLSDPSHADYLNVAATYYPLYGRLVTLPRRLDGHPLANEIVEPILRSRERFVAIEWYANGAQAIQWLSQRAEGEGYRVSLRDFGGVRVAFFKIPGGTPR